MKQWLWLAYPVGVILVLFLSTKVLFGPTGVLAHLAQNQTQLQQQQVTSSQLKAKLAVLQATNLDSQQHNLNYLLTILPANKNLPLLLAQIQQAASNSGAIVLGFNGQVGQVSATDSASQSDNKFALAVDLAITNMAQLQTLLNHLETSLPLLQVNKVNLTDGKANIVIEGLWSPLTKLPAGAEHPVTDVQPQVAEISDRFKNYWQVSPGEALPDTGVNLVPF